MRRPFIAGNWKMHMTRAEAQELATALKGQLTDTAHRIMVAPPFTSIEAVASILQGSPIEVGAQNMAAERSGAHTGEISPAMLKDVGATVVVLGHSERRHVYGESDELINAKVTLALEEDLHVVLCIGETLEEREAGRVDEINRRQLDGGLKGVPASVLGNITIAYEPVWAIGTGKTATPEDADTVHAAVRTIMADLYDDEAAGNIVIQYGGSVKPGNVKGLMAKENIDGALVGGASLQADTFVPIAQFDM
ncbi:MAG: triose-phosphate isomerase [Spirochaetales bacterium]|nr:triose-phosphate isomerase [Spirochaetales bacterium]